MGVHRVPPGQLGSQSVLALSPRQPGLHRSTRSPKVQGQEVICIPDGRKKGRGLACRLLEPWPQDT